MMEQRWSTSTNTSGTTAHPLVKNESRHRPCTRHQHQLKMDRRLISYKAQNCKRLLKQHRNKPRRQNMADAFFRDNTKDITHKRNMR